MELFAARVIRRLLLPVPSLVAAVLAWVVAGLTLRWTMPWATHATIMARVNDLEHELPKVVAGDVRFDPISRLLYSTAAAKDQVEPRGVVIPRHEEDVHAGIEVTALLADGTRVVFGDITRAELEAKGRRSGLEGQIYREVARIRDEYGDEIRARYPQHWRRVAGYNLNELVAVGIKPGSFAGGGGALSEGGRAPADPRGRPRGLNMARLVVGSEGTLLTIVEARVRLVQRPRTTALDVIHYRDLQEALESSQSILETGPYAVEVTDKMIPDLARENIEQSQRMGFVQGDPAAILIVEYAGESDAEVRAKVAALEARRQRERFGYAATLAFDPVEQQSIWKLRKAGLGLLLGMKGGKKPIAFVEDTPVHPKHLAEFVPRVRDVFAKHDAVGAYYGHCSVGCLHIRPVINLKTPRGLEQVRAIADEITSLVLEFGGTISSEHGDVLA